MAITVEDAITKLTTGYWNKFARTEANPGGFGANGHVENLPALAEALGVVGDFVGTQGALADQVLAIQAEITAVANNAANIEAVADNLAAVLAAAANMAAIIAAPTHAATATAGALQAQRWAETAEDTDVPGAPGGSRSARHYAAKSEESAGQAQAAVGGVRVTSNDTIAGALSDKIQVAGGMAKQVVNPGANETLLLTAPAQIGAGGAEASGSVVLTAASPAVQAVTTTGSGQSVTLPDATTLAKGVPHYAISNKGNFDLSIKDATGTIRGFLGAGESTVAALADNVDAAGVWVLPGTRLLGVSAALDVSGVDYGGSSYVQSISIDATRSLILYGTINVYAMVLDEETSTLGTPVLAQANAQSQLRTLLIATDTVLLVYAMGSSIVARVLTIDGMNVTVGASASAASGGSVGLGQLIACDGAYVLSYGRAGSAACLIAMTVSGSTVTLGAKVDVLTGTSNNPNVHYAGTNKVLVVASTTSTIRAVPYTLSGASLAVGTASDWSNPSGAEPFRSLSLGTGRWVVLFNNASAQFAGRVISVSGSTATSSSTAVLSLAGGLSNIHQVDAAWVADDKVLLVSGNGTTFICNILTDDSGTAVAGTELNFPCIDSIAGNSIAIVSVNDGIATVATGTSNRLVIRRIDATTGSPAYLDGTAVSTPLNLAGSAHSLPNGDLRPRVLRSGSVSALTTRADVGYPALVVGGQVMFSPPLPVVENLAYPGRDASEAWCVFGTGTTRPVLLQRVTLAQP